ncbi:hypothetical protein [Azospirillum rugosum]|uniref:Uncharacterized protein n=1 Tax=Azospirillum rugosum TaxID=416170 RepID=A0ABS4SFE2_9PROT|nr:hypothetical protein [Azospirillum rugosum]MBP2291294.1 hypothetical protein [Azospirillum rugosum]MDQ0525082.1 hypothetical protein [Azospirillum rugosum]
MAKAREKGKIPHGDWSAIRTRHAAGESLASIARDYGCTGPAIRYIINRPTDAPASAGDAQPDAAPAPAATPPAPAPARETAPPSSPPTPAPGIDPELRWRVSSEIASFLTVFDSFLTSDSPARYDELLAATDRLMRVAARTHIELERARAADQRARGAKAGPRA